MFQTLFLVLKADRRIEAEWKQIVFGFILVFFICGAMLVSMATFLAINRLCFREPLGSIKHKGLAYVAINMLGFMGLSAIPTLLALFGVGSGVTSMPVVLAAALSHMFSGRYKK